MEKWREIIVQKDTTILETMKIIDESSLQFSIVTDENHCLIGTVTDGDIRRGLLKGESLDTEIEKVMNISPYFGLEGKKGSFYKKVLRRKKLKQLPIVNDKHQVVNVFFLDEAENVYSRENRVVLMVGGLGTRLRPLTNEVPKPMLHVGNKPILETIIESFKSYGFTKFILSVNYKKEIIQEYFQDGSDLGVTIKYIEEDKRMGTAGALSLLNENTTHPIFVMNGDLLTSVNFDQLLEFHLDSNSIATMCVREYEYQIPYGVIETDGQQLISIVEKPLQRSYVNAGIYILSPKALKRIPKDEFFDMPDLFKVLIEADESVSAFPIRENWLDIGKLDDYEKANIEFRRNSL